MTIRQRRNCCRFSALNLLFPVRVFLLTYFLFLCSKWKRWEGNNMTMFICISQCSLSPCITSALFLLLYFQSIAKIDSVFFKIAFVQRMQSDRENCERKKKAETTAKNNKLSQKTLCKRQLCAVGSSDDQCATCRRAKATRLNGYVWTLHAAGITCYMHRQELAARPTFFFSFFFHLR